MIRVTVNTCFFIALETIWVSKYRKENTPLSLVRLKRFLYFFHFKSEIFKRNLEFFGFLFKKFNVFPYIKEISLFYHLNYFINQF